MRLQFTSSATRDLSRVRDFIAEKAPQAATRASRRLGRTRAGYLCHPSVHLHGMRVAYAAHW